MLPAVADAGRVRIVLTHSLDQLFVIIQAGIHVLHTVFVGGQCHDAQHLAVDHLNDIDHALVTTVADVERVEEKLLFYLAAAAGP